MELKINQEIENALFNRKEVQAEVEAEVIPSKAEVAKALAEKFSSSEEAINVELIQGKFGSKTFKINADIYKTKEDKDSTVTKTKKQRAAEAKALEEAKKAEEDAKKAEEEAKAAAEATESPKEESKPEEKAENSEEKKE